MTETNVNRALDVRTALPDSLAYLRAAYPRAAWRSHANFGELTSFWLHIHQTLRAEGAQLQQAMGEFQAGKQNAAQFPHIFAAHKNRFLQHLSGHHQIEDQVYFPKFRALDPRMVAGFDLLEADHHTIHDALGRSVKSAQDFLASFGHGPDASKRAAESYAADADLLLGLLLRHLADEEDLVVPAMLHHGERSVS